MKKYWLEIAIIVIFIAKLWMVSVQPIYVKGYSHDDGLFVKNATSIVQGNWLGEYDDMTLSKGVTAILFIASTYKVGISYLLAQQILYFLACVSIIYVLKNVINKKWLLLLCYIVLLFNPISYSDAFSYVYRDGIYTILVLFLVSFSLSMFFNYKNILSKLILDCIAFGITLAAIWLCREETIWIYPYLAVGSIIIVSFIIKDTECSNKIKRILCIIGIPIGILIIYSMLICSYNYRYYGRFITNDFNSKEFKDVYGALTRIKQENYIKRVPLNEETRKKLYELSPQFRKLRNYLDSEYRIVRSKNEINQNGKKYYDYQEGFLYWALRKAVYEMGYYKNAETAEQYYIDLANEINELCDSR